LPVQKNQLAPCLVHLETGHNAAGMPVVWLGVRRILRSMSEQVGAAANFLNGKGLPRSCNQSIRAGNDGDIMMGAEPAWTS
jgi:hypothetical protein